MKKLLIVVDAPGTAEFIAPVIPLIKGSAKIQLVTVKESPTKILERFKPIRCDQESGAAAIYKKFSPDILLVAISSLVTGPYVNNKFTELAHSAGAKIICFQDIWANHRWPVNFKMMPFWKTLLTIDELAENFILQDGYTGKVIVTGNPSFDRFRGENVAKERKRLRKKFGVDDKTFIILYCGAGTPAAWKVDQTTFEFLAKAVKDFQGNHPSSLLIARQHPRDEKPGRYQELAPNLKYLDTSAIPFTEDLLPIADVVVGMYATNLIHACYLRIPGISILLPNAGKERLEKNLGLSDFPTNAVGATTGIYKEDVALLENEFTKIMNDPVSNKIVQSIQARLFKFGKQPAAKKAAAAIKKELR